MLITASFYVLPILKCFYYSGTPKVRPHVSQTETPVGVPASHVRPLWWQGKKRERETGLLFSIIKIVKREQKQLVWR